MTSRRRRREDREAIGFREMVSSVSQMIRMERRPAETLFVFLGQQREREREDDESERVKDAR